MEKVGHAARVVPAARTWQGGDTAAVSARPTTRYPKGGHFGEVKIAFGLLRLFWEC